MKKELEIVTNVGATFLLINYDQSKSKVWNFFNRFFGHNKIAYPVFTGNFIVNNRDIDILHNQDIEADKDYDIELEKSGFILRVVTIKAPVPEYYIIKIIKLIQWCQEIDNWTYLKALHEGEELLSMPIDEELATA